MLSEMSFDVTAFIMGVAYPERMKWLYETINYMDSQNFPFKKKIVSIDQFGGQVVRSGDIDYFHNKGWDILIDSHRSRNLSMDRAFKEIDTEYIFYNEDDVMATMPKMEDLLRAFNTESEGRKCGMISMTLGGTQYDPKSKFIGDLKYMEENVILESDSYIIFKRLESFANDYFFEFPGLWIRTSLFKDCHERAKGFGGQIEEALTKGYNNSGNKIKYYKCSIAKKGSLNILLDDPSKVNSHCRLLSNLDSFQGLGAIGGNHFY